MFKQQSGSAKPMATPDLITLAQKLARDAEHHALLSASLASQAERLMRAGLRERERRTPAPPACPPRF